MRLLLEKLLDILEAVFVFRKYFFGNMAETRILMIIFLRQKYF